MPNDVFGGIDVGSGGSAGFVGTPESGASAAYDTSDPWAYGGLLLQNQYNSSEAVKADKRTIQMALQGQQFNAAESQKARDYEERLSNTAIQRRMADLKAAGINPALAYADNSSSASTPSGQSASSSARSSSGGGRSGDIAKGILSAVALAITKGMSSAAKLSGDVAAQAASTAAATGAAVGSSVSSKDELPKFDKLGEILRSAERTEYPKSFENEKDYKDYILSLKTR